MLGAKGSDLVQDSKLGFLKCWSVFRTPKCNLDEHFETPSCESIGDRNNKCCWGWAD